MDVLMRKTDRKARLTLPGDFASCLVTIERQGDELRIRKARKVVARRYSFRQLMAGVTKANIHAEIKTGPPVGREAL
jgi:antitoxin component of MazEF toxin-antitoxin module